MLSGVLRRRRASSSPWPTWAAALGQLWPIPSAGRLTRGGEQEREESERAAGL